MHESYDDLTLVTVFMHDNGSWSCANWRDHSTHTPFDTFKPSVTSAKHFVTEDCPFLHVGVELHTERWEMDGFHRPARKVRSPMALLCQTNDRNNPPTISLDAPPMDLTFTANVYFAVSKDQIKY
jgi:hypothetical protein